MKISFSRQTKERAFKQLYEDYYAPFCLYAKRFVDDKEVIFTSLEYRILLLLFTNVNKIVTREMILDKIWDMAGNFVNDNTLTVYIKRIRTKLNNDLIKTVKGLGYRVEC